MVKRINVSIYTGEPPSSEDPRRIEGGPLYAKDAVNKALNNSTEASIRLWTKDCIRDVQKLDLEMSDVKALVLEAMELGRFLECVWCEQTTAGPWAACDSYLLRKREWNRFAHKELTVEYFVKFAIGICGSVVLVVSCHPPEK